MSFTDKNLYNKTYKVNTVEASELILYAVDPLPEVTTVSVAKTKYSDTDNKVTVNWNGTVSYTHLKRRRITQ